MVGRKIDENFTLSARVEKKLSYDFDGDIYFNNTDGFNLFHGEIIDSIKSAKKTIQIAIYSIRDSEIINLLQEKKDQGVDVEIVVPKSKASQHKKAFIETTLKIVEVGTLEGEENTNELMHHKFILVDADYKNKQLIFGSSNFTYLQQKYDPSFIVKTSDNNLVDIFQHEFNLLKEGKYGLKKISTRNFKPFAFNGKYKNGFVDIWFGPGYMKNSVKSKILEYIYDAESSINIIGWRINDVDIYKALEKKSNEGIPVSVIMDDYYMWDFLSIAHRFKKNTKINFFSDSFMHIMLDNREKLDDELNENFNSFLHHHTLIIDNKILVAGTNNWGRGGFHYNDESVVVTNIENLVQGYVRQFGYLHRKLYGEKLVFDINKKNILNIKNISDKWSKIILYKEKEDENWLGNICVEFNRNKIENNFLIPAECSFGKIRIFLVDNDSNLIASSYLK